jgi:hypothetical protein
MSKELRLTAHSRPVFTYLKSRGFYAGVQVDGTVIIERADENERFYGERIGVADILAGKARHPPYQIKMLMETVKAAEGRTDVDHGMLAEIADQPAPGDVDVEAPAESRTHTFGIPEPDDPDPFGVLALEKEGFEIREAGTKSRPPSTQFDFNPSPTSPIYGRFHRRSMDTLATRSNRESYMSTRSTRTRMSTERSTQTSEMGTQTDDTITPSTSPSLSDHNRRIVEEDEKTSFVEPEEIDYTKIDLGAIRHLTQTDDLDGTTVNESPREHSGSEHQTQSADTSFHAEDEEESDMEEEEPVIFEAASAQATIITPQAIKARGGLVNIPKRPPPPPLPPRNLLRASRPVMVDAASGRTPTSPSRDGFENVELRGAGTDRKSVELAKPVETEKPVLMEKVEEESTADTPLPRAETSHLDVEEALNNEHGEDITPQATNEVEKSIHDDDSFHSVPTTPFENATEVKAM